ncbi:MAG: sortase [Chloroflexi bacterium]|nr:MAG: sortase [Chloroflexota bacterium]
MMYRRQSGGSGRAILIVIILGIIAGAVFFIMDSRGQESGQGVAIVPQNNDGAAVPEAGDLFGSSDEAPAPPEVDESRIPDDVSLGSNIVIDGVDPNTETSLFLPTLGVQAPVIETFLNGSSWDVSNLGTNVGHLQGTSWLNTPGNIVLSGHVELADGRPGIFENLNELQIGDPIILTEEGVERRYVVTDLLVVEPDDLSVLYPTTHEQLTLITCGAYNFFSDTYQERVVAIAELIV